MSDYKSEFATVKLALSKEENALDDSVFEEAESEEAEEIEETEDISELEEEDLEVLAEQDLLDGAPAEENESPEEE